MLVPTALNAQTYTPLYGLHTDYGLVLGYPDMEEFVRVLSEKGYSTIMYMIAEACPDPATGYANYRFVSPTLESLGWTFVRDELSELVSAANTYDMELIVDVQALTYVALNPDQYPLVTPPSTSDVANIVHELAAYGVEGVSEEMFLAEWFAPVRQACHSAGIVYEHKAIHWDFGAMSDYWNSTVYEVYPNCDLMMTEDYEMTLDPPHMVGNEQFPSIARWLGNGYHIKVSADEWALRSLPNAENVILMKAIQFKPTYIYIMTWNTDHVASFDPAAMTSLIQEYVSDQAKPVCNVVLYLTGDEPPDTWDWWDFPAVLAPMSNGTKASGFDIVTTPTPIDNADLYYIFTRGKWEWGTTLDLPSSIVELFDSGKPVFLQVSQILPNTTANWNAVRSKLGIDHTTFERIQNSDSILSGSYNGIEYQHLRAGEASFMNNIRPENVLPPAEVTSTGVLYDTLYALIVRNGNNYFINGTHLDLRASFPISNLLNDGLQGPTACVATAGNTSVFYCLDQTDGEMDSTRLHVKLPDSSIREIRWFKRDFHGVVSSGTAAYDPQLGYMDTLAEGTLLILRPSLTGIDAPGHFSHLSTPAVSLCQNYPNPFSQTTTVPYSLQGGRGAEEQTRGGDRQKGRSGRESHIPNRTSEITLAIYDLSGRVVRTLIHEQYNHPTVQLSNQIVWDGRDDHGKKVSSGIYFCVLREGSNQQEKKMILIR